MPQPESFSAATQVAAPRLPPLRWPRRDSGRRHSSRNRGHLSFCSFYLEASAPRLLNASAQVLWRHSGGHAYGRWHSSRGRGHPEDEMQKSLECHQCAGGKNWCQKAVSHMAQVPTRRAGGPQSIHSINPVASFAAFRRQESWHQPLLAARCFLQALVSQPGQGQDPKLLCQRRQLQQKC